jgi:hypothetical protein
MEDKKAVRERDVLSTKDGVSRPSSWSLDLRTSRSRATLYLSALGGREK